MRILSIIILMLFVFSTYGQKKTVKSSISTKTQNTVKKIAKVNEFMGGSVGFAGMTPTQFNNFQELKKNASKTELLKLTSHNNGVVRCYSIWALSSAKSVDLFPITLSHINDNQFVKTQFGCIGGRERVGDIFIRITKPYFDSVQTATLDSILFNKPNKLNAKSNLIDRISLTEQNYPRIRELAKKGNQSAIVKLAKYRKEQDINLILKNKDKSKYSPYRYTYKAIQNYPSPKFLPFLKIQLENTLDHDHYSGEWKELYKAIANYKNEKSLKLLTIPFTEVVHKHIRKYHLEFIYCALRDNHDTIYDNLLWTYWIEEEILTPDIYNYLLIKNPEKGFKQTVLVLNNPDNYYTAAICRNYSINESKVLIENMIDLVLNKDKGLGIKLIKKNFEKINVHLLETFANKAMVIKDKSFITPLFDLLENESNPHTYLIAARTLISYKDEIINQRVLSAKKININLTKGWGAKDFESLLKDNNIK